MHSSLILHACYCSVPLTVWESDFLRAWHQRRKTSQNQRPESLIRQLNCKVAFWYPLWLPPKIPRSKDRSFRNLVISSETKCIPKAAVRRLTSRADNSKAPQATRQLTSTVGTGDPVLHRKRKKIVWRLLESHLGGHWEREESRIPVLVFSRPNSNKTAGTVPQGTTTNIWEQHRL